MAEYFTILNPLIHRHMINAFYTHEPFLHAGEP